MRIFFAGQGRTRVCGEAYFMYAAAGNPRRTQSSVKRAIYGWTLPKRVSNIQPDVGFPAAVAADSVAFCFAHALGDNLRLNRLYLVFLQ